MPIYCHATGLYFAPISAIFETIITVINMGIIIGKLNIAIMPKLLFDREEIAATIVKSEAKPRLPKIKAAKYKG